MGCTQPTKYDPKHLSNSKTTHKSVKDPFKINLMETKDEELPGRMENYLNDDIPVKMPKNAPPQTLEFYRIDIKMLDCQLENLPKK